MLRSPVAQAARDATHTRVSRDHSASCSSHSQCLDHASNGETLDVDLIPALTHGSPRMLSAQEARDSGGERRSIGDVSQQHGTGFRPQRLGQVAPCRHHRLLLCETGHRTRPPRGDPVGIWLKEEVAGRDVFAECRRLDVAGRMHSRRPRRMSLRSRSRKARSPIRAARATARTDCPSPLAAALRAMPTRVVRTSRSDPTQPSILRVPSDERPQPNQRRRTSPHSGWATTPWESAGRGYTDEIAAPMPGSISTLGVPRSTGRRS